MLAIGSFSTCAFRPTLAPPGETMRQTPEKVESWRRNIGHEGGLTAFYSHSSVAQRRQGEMINALVRPTSESVGHAHEVVRAMLAAMRRETSFAHEQ